MAEVSIQFRPEAFTMDPDTSFPRLRLINGTNFGYPALFYGPSTDRSAYFFFRALQYVGGNDIEVDIDWYADNATSGNVVWGAAVAAMTPLDTTQIGSKNFDTENTVTTSNPGTSSGRLIRSTITIGSADNDGMVQDDWVILEIRRLASDGSDTMANDAAVVGITVRYDNT